MYRIENKTEAIRNVQKYLGYIYGNDSNVQPNGIFDTKTENELKKFQLSHGLEQTGVADYITFTALYDDYKRAVLDYNTRQNANKRINFPVSEGDYGDGVAEINGMIEEFLLRHSIHFRIQNKMLFSSESIAAVQQIREILLLDMSDSVDEEMYRRMKNDEFSSRPFM